jgi:hypothetical protein
LEDTLKAFIQSNTQIIQELKDATMVNSQSMYEIKDATMGSSQSMYEIEDATMANIEVITRLEGQLSHVDGEFNIIEEEEFQSQDMVKGQYMIDENNFNNSNHKHVQATTFGSEEVVKETVNESSLEDPLKAPLAQIGDNLYLDKLLEQAVEPFIVDNYYSMPSLYNHPPQDSLVQHFPTAHFDDLEERVNQFMATKHVHTQFSHTHASHHSCSYYYHPSHQDDCPFISHYVIKVNKFAHEHTQTTTIFFSEEKVVNKVEEKEEQIEPPPMSNLSNEKEVSIEAHSFVTIPLETQHEPQVSPFQCLKEPSYVEIFKESRTQDHKSRNRVPKRILRSKQLGYIRWQSILPKGYQVLKKKGWKGLVGHPHDRGRCGILSFLFSALYF